MARVQKTIRLDSLGELTPADLDVLATERGTTAPGLKAIRATHHSLARLLSSGVPPGEAAIAVGLSPSRVSILQSDPAFQDLLKVHQNNKDLVILDVMQKVAQLTTTAIEEIQDRILDTPEDVTTGQLLDIANSGLDRLGHGPIHNHNVRHYDVTGLKAAADLARASKVSYRQISDGDGAAIIGPVLEGEIDSTPTSGNEV